MSGRKADVGWQLIVTVCLVFLWADAGLSWYWFAIILLTGMVFNLADALAARKKE